MSSTISIALVMAISLASAGCVASRPAHYYTIEPPSVPTNPSNPGGLVLLVGNIAASEAVQDSRIRYRVGANEAGAYEYHRWTERPTIMIRKSLLRALRASGKYQSVLESSSSVTGDYLLRGKLYEFGEVDRASIQTRISLQVELLDKKANRNVWDHLAEHEVPVSSKDINDVVQSLDRNVEQVVSEIAAEIDRFLAAAGPRYDLLRAGGA